MSGLLAQICGMTAGLSRISFACEAGGCLSCGMTELAAAGHRHAPEGGEKGGFEPES
jgi:hypothetical protein